MVSDNKDLSTSTFRVWCSMVVGSSYSSTDKCSSTLNFRPLIEMGCSNDNSRHILSISESAQKKEEKIEYGLYYSCLF